MDYLLDTCVVSDLVKGDRGTVSHFKSITPAQVGISSVTAYELRYGLLKNPQIRSSTKQAVLGFLIDVTILPFGDWEANTASEIRAGLEKSGTPIGAYDVLIAATALSRELILVTSNEREFTRVPELTIENWRNA
ncbi:MAG: type II toxin-antitoxin system VapC family toxin [Cyclobacteriaceae bacterium]|nr:type II toxin-antitoxin system VapC family toxin [Cyclobacteriaceae bacterium HetDA_MAG_MS6]